MLSILSLSCYVCLYTAIRILFNVPRDTQRYLIESISQCLHVKTILASSCVSFYETIEASFKLFIRFFFLVYTKMTLTQFLAVIYFLLQTIVLSIFLILVNVS